MKINWTRLPRRIPLMVASVLLAFLLWMLVIGEEKIEAGLMVPLVFDKIPPSVVIDGSPPGSVYVQIKGARQAVEDILPQQVQARVDLSSAKPGSDFIQITTQDIVFPPGITLLGIYPPYLDMKFLAKRPVPIKVRTVGKPAEGFEVSDISVLPLQVEIIGPENRVGVITEVQTFPVDIRGVSGTVKTNVEIVSPGDDIRLLQLRQTEVSIQVREMEVRKIFTNVKVQVGDENLKITPSKVRVELSGPYHSMKALEVTQVPVRLDLEVTPTAPDTRPLKADAPEGIQVISIKPPMVRVK